MVHLLQIPTLVAGFLQQSLGAMQEFVEILCDEIINSFRPQEWLCDLVQLVSYVDGAVSQLHIRQGWVKPRLPPATLYSPARFGFVAKSFSVASYAISLESFPTTSNSSIFENF